MGIDLTKFKVIYEGRVLNAVGLGEMCFAKKEGDHDHIRRPEWIEVVAIDTDGTLIFIKDETREFQFIPQLT